MGPQMNGFNGSPHPLFRRRHNELGLLMISAEMLDGYSQGGCNGIPHLGQIDEWPIKRFGVRVGSTIFQAAGLFGSEVSI
jgi:hypothetical protein